jgi:hypothetical protein
MLRAAHVGRNKVLREASDLPGEHEQSESDFTEIERNVQVLRRGCICPLQCVMEPAELFYFCNVICLCPIFEEWFLKIIFWEVTLCGPVNKRTPAFLRNLTATDLRAD